MGRNSFKPAKHVLVFNGAKTLVAKVSSLQSTAKIFFTTPQAISFACSGKYISSSSFYFRHENENIQIEDEDFGKLNLLEYDKMCGEKRRYHSVKKMAQKHRAIEQNKDNKNTNKPAQASKKENDE